MHTRKIRVYVGVINFLCRYGNSVNLNDAMMTTTVEIPFTVNGLGFATPKADSRWQIPRDLGECVLLYDSFILHKIRVD